MIYKTTLQYDPLSASWTLTIPLLGKVFVAATRQKAIEAATESLHEKDTIRLIYE